MWPGPRLGNLYTNIILVVFIKGFIYIFYYLYIYFRFLIHLHFKENKIETIMVNSFYIEFWIFRHLADDFVQSNRLSVHVFTGYWTHDLGVARSTWSGLHSCNFELEEKYEIKKLPFAISAFKIGKLTVSFCHQLHRLPNQSDQIRVHLQHFISAHVRSISTLSFPVSTPAVCSMCCTSPVMRH